MLVKNYVDELIYISDEGKYEFEKYSFIVNLDQNENLANKLIKDKLFKKLYTVNAKYKSQIILDLSCSRTNVLILKKKLLFLYKKTKNRK